MSNARRAPGLGRALRDAAVDLYYHSVRLVPANLVWGAALVLVMILASQGAWLGALLASSLLALALVGTPNVSATGVTGPNLDELSGLDRERVLNAIENGGTGQGRMPAGLLRGQDAEDVAAYVARVAGQ